MLINISSNVQAQQEQSQEQLQQPFSANQTASPINNTVPNETTDVESLMEQGVVGSPDEPFNPNERRKQMEQSISP